MIISIAGCAAVKVEPTAEPVTGPETVPEERLIEEPLEWSRLSSPYTYDVGGVRADGYQLVTILTYHDIRETSHSQMQVASQEFEEQMAYLHDNGYSVISLDRFYSFLNLRQGVPEKSVVITFDDGWKTVYTAAYPILKKYGFPATIFIYTDFISPGNRMALTWEMMKELSAGGVDIQVHSRTHEMNMAWKKEGETDQQYRDRLDNELIAPKNMAEKQIGKRIKYIAYPYGQFNDTLIEAARKAGYEGGLTVFGATVDDGEVVRKRDNPVFNKPFEVNRVQVLGNT
ncbi:MAG: polysaccharide deacetylase family protein, partial [Nitrospirota bacterium]